MGVYIKEFDVPKDCAECDDDGLRGLVGCRFFSFGIGRPPFCPLIEVPEPHGRLIDGDELKTAFPRCDNSTPVLVASVRATINHAPTVIESEGE